MATNYQKMNYEELKAHRDQIDALMQQKLEETKAELRSEFLERAQKFGLALSDIVGETRKARTVKNKSDRAPKYANPSNPSETWSGRGGQKRAPAWVQEHLKRGKLEDLVNPHRG